MDAISPEYRVGPNGEGANCRPGEWQISETPPLMFHQPTRLVFEIYRDATATSPRLSLFELRSRLAHVCDGHTVPSDELTRLGQSAIFAFTLLTDECEFVENNVSLSSIPTAESDLSDDSIPF